VTTPGELTRPVMFQKRGLDTNGDPLGDWVDVVGRMAKIGSQPVIVYVRRDLETKLIDNSYRVVDALEPATTWEVASVIRNEREDMMEVLAIQKPNGSDA
jgi:hypothetical protein